MRCPLLVNVKAGGIFSESGPAQIQHMAARIGLELDIVPLHTPEDLRKELKRLVGDRAERVAVAGGDGTMAQAVQVLAGSKTALGILSLGTFNNFATALRLPHNLPAALEAIKDGAPRSIDLGCVNGRYFTESAGVGLFADGLALYGAGTNKNFLQGLYCILRLALSFRPRLTELVVDGKPVEGRVSLCEIANTYRIAQAVPIAPEASVTDGLLDVVIIRDLERREILNYLKALRAQMHLDLPKVQILQGKRIELGGRRRNVHCDDAAIGQTPCTVEVHPGALQVLVNDDR